MRAIHELHSSPPSSTSNAVFSETKNRSGRLVVTIPKTVVTKLRLFDFDAAKPVPSPSLPLFLPTYLPSYKPKAKMKLAVASFLVYFLSVFASADSASSVDDNNAVVVDNNAVVVDNAAIANAGVDWIRPSGGGGSSSSGGPSMEEISVLVSISGFDPDDLTTVEEAFMEDAMQYSMALATASDNNITPVASHFVSKMSEDNGDGPGGNLRGRRERRGGYRFSSGYGCRSCGRGDDDQLLGDQFLGDDILNVWKTNFVDILENSRFDTFASMSDVSFERVDGRLSHQGEIPVAKAVASAL